MNHRPVCVKCEIEMRPETNGIGLLDMASYGPYKIWDADKWKCPNCNFEVIIGFAQKAIAEYYQESFQRVVQDYATRGLLVRNYERRLKYGDS